MSRNTKPKTSILKCRVEEDIADIFTELCDKDCSSVSQTLRKFIHYKVMQAKGRDTLASNFKHS